LATQTPQEPAEGNGVYRQRRLNIDLPASGAAFPTCWVVAESEAQWVNKMEIFLKKLYPTDRRIVHFVYDHLG
jgi:hypothetical protein